MFWLEKTFFLGSSTTKIEDKQVPGIYIPGFNFRINLLDLAWLLRCWPISVPPWVNKTSGIQKSSVESAIPFVGVRQTPINIPLIQRFKSGFARGNMSPFFEGFVVVVVVVRFFTWTLQTLRIGRCISYPKYPKPRTNQLLWRNSWYLGVCEC